MVSFAIAFPDGFMALVDTYDVKRYSASRQNSLGSNLYYKNSDFDSNTIINLSLTPTPATNNISKTNNYSNNNNYHDNDTIISRSNGNSELIEKNNINSSDDQKNCDIKKIILSNNDMIENNCQYLSNGVINCDKFNLQKNSLNLDRNDKIIIKNGFCDKSSSNGCISLTNETNLPLNSDGKSIR